MTVLGARYCKEGQQQQQQQQQHQHQAGAPPEGNESTFPIQADTARQGGL